jgi:hypothetical protein
MGQVYMPRRVLATNKARFFHSENVLHELACIHVTAHCVADCSSRRTGLPHGLGLGNAIRSKTFAST